ncbi:hypothetical protein B0H13DRAFT_2456394 [Mycena leptocephala]|nr:hypothetical protein B0H13DRAFT_2456394 [Mycena leptocephala]
MAPPPGMHCPMCNNFLIPRLTKSGLAPNTYLAQCVNPRHAPFNFRFGPEYSPPTPALALPLPSRVTSELSKVTSGQPRATLGEPRRCVGNTTEGRQCKSTRVDLACSRNMCRKHCNAAASQTSSVPNTIAIAPPPLPRQQPADPWHLSFDDILTDVTRPLRLLSEYQAQEEARAAEEGRLLDIAVGILPESPELSVEDELMRRMEQDDCAFAYRLSQELNGANGDLFPPSPPPTAIAGPSRLRALSPSPDLPSHITIPSPLPALSRATAPDTTGTNKRPRQRVGAASAVAKHRPTPSFNITTQMNQTWMSQNGGGSTSSSQTLPPSQATPLPSTVFHVRQGGSRRQFADRRQMERFTLLYLTGSDPRILSVDASELTVVPWPSYQLSTDKKTCDALGTDLQQDLDVFLECQRVWMSIDTTFIHSVSKDCVVVVRRRGVHGPEDDEIIEKFLPRTAPAPAHLRYNVKAECTAVRATLNTLKGNAPLIILDSDSDNDMEVSAITAASTSRKRRIKREDNALVTV